MTNYIVTNDELTSVANSIRAKSGTSNSLIFPSGFIDAIDSLPAGGNDVNFRDYDGTIVRSYSAADFANLTEFPSNPDHTSENLTAQGWNWTLSDAKTYVAKYGRLEIGQMYTTTDGKTHIHIRLKQGRTSPMLGVCPNGTVDVDWGDGTAHDTLTGTSVTAVQWTSNHSYAEPGDYVIKLTVTGSMGFYGTSQLNQYSGLLRYSSSADGRNDSYQTSILNVNIGDNVTSIGNYAFYICRSLSSITIPDSVTSIDSNAFYYCYSLSSITIPDSVTSIGTSVFDSCSSLSSVIISNSVTSIGSYMFSDCHGLSSITIPDNVTRIESYAFNNCYSLSSITIPDSVTSIGNYVFYFCQRLSSVTIPDGITSINSNTFSYCHKLSSITIPNSVTHINSSAFIGCSSLSGVIIPDNVISIGSSAFYSCRNLLSITIPNGVTSINSSTFYNCTGVAEYHLKSTTPPTLANSNAFTGILADCIIYVPYSADHSILNAYKTATNWSTYAAKMQEEPQ